MTNADSKKKLNELLSMPAETEWVEFKAARGEFDFDSLGRYFSALSNEANLHGQSFGWLVLGVTNNSPREICGTRYKEGPNALNKLKHDIAQDTNHQMTFHTVHELADERGRVLLFQIPAAINGVPTEWRGKVYGRHGESVSPLSIGEIDRIRAPLRDDWSAKVCSEASFDHLDPAAVGFARDQFKEKHPKLAVEMENWDDITFLNKAKVCIDGRVTHAALLLLGKPEFTHLLSPAVAQITWVLKDDQGREKDYAHFGPPFILNVEKVLSKIRNLNYRYLPGGTLFPIEITQYDPWIIREAFHNCIAHQNYELHGRINVVEGGDVLLFTNLGSFIPGSIERVIELDSPPDTYRNRFLADAMVHLNMIDTIGSGIRKMYLKQKERFFPLPDYDLSKPDRVELRIQGKIIDPNYTQLLVRNPDLDLAVVMMLDKVQKKMPLSKDQHRFLKIRELVEGRFPNLYLAAHVAALTGDKASYIKNRAFHDRHYKDMVIAYLAKYGRATRRDIDTLLYDQLSDALNESQKMNKIRNILYSMSKKDKGIRNVGSSKNPKWILSDSNK